VTGNVAEELEMNGMDDECVSDGCSVLSLPAHL